MTESPYSLTNPPFTLSVSTLPVSVPKSDIVLLANDYTHVAAIAFRALPGAVIFQLLIKVKDADGKAPLQPPSIAFADMEYLLGADDFRIGARMGDSGGRATDLPVYASGGGGDGSFEYIAWFPLPPSCVTLELTAEWKDRDLPRRSVGLDLERIRDTAGRSTKVW